MIKIILDLCGGTGSWSKPYREAGYEVHTITLPNYDVLNWYSKEHNDYICFRGSSATAPNLEFPIEDIYGILAAPPCTEFSIAKYFHGKGNYTHDTESAMKIVNSCLKIIDHCDPVFWALENPGSGRLKEFIGKPKYIFDAWEFGDTYQKRTALWGEFNEPIKTVQNKPDGIKKFSMLYSKEIEPDYYGIYDRTTRRAMTSKHFAKAFFEVNQ